MALIRIIENNQLKDLNLDFAAKQFRIIAMELPFYVEINKKGERIILDYSYMSRVTPLDKVETNELNVSYGQYSGRIARVEFKTGVAMQESNWKYILTQFRHRIQLDSTSNAIVNFSSGLEIAKACVRNYLNSEAR